MSNTNIDNCDIVQDLLPLYYDDACSPASRKWWKHIWQNVRNADVHTRI